MYCIKCGVKLADTEKQCPLCQTVVFHPDITREEAAPLYPTASYPAPQVSSRGIQIILTALFLLPMLITLQCDLYISGSVTWSGYVIGALLLGYVTAVLPSWFRHPNPVIFVPCSFATLGLYLLYIDLSVQGGWFLSFGLPVVGFICGVVTAVVALLRYVRRGRLYILGGAFAALGAFMPLMGFLLNLTFFASTRFAFWSLYPTTSLVLLGGTLIFLAICRPARETMQRKLFI